LNTETDYSKLV